MVANMFGIAPFVHLLTNGTSFSVGEDKRTAQIDLRK